MILPNTNKNACRFYIIAMDISNRRHTDLTTKGKDIILVELRENDTPAQFTHRHSGAVIEAIPISEATAKTIHMHFVDDNIPMQSGIVYHCTLCRFANEKKDYWQTWAAVKSAATQPIKQ